MSNRSACWSRLKRGPTVSGGKRHEDHFDHLIRYVEVNLGVPGWFIIKINQ
jgi:hypothetical protein